MHSGHLTKLNHLIASVGEVTQPHQQYAFLVRDISAAQTWMISAVAVVEAVCPAGSSYINEIRLLGANRKLGSDTNISHIQRMLGILNAVRSDADAGILRSPEDIAFATAFDDFLDHALEFRRLGKIGEAAVLGSVVLEDAMKRISKKHGVPHSGQSLDPLIDLLAKAGVFTSIKAKRLKAYAGVRNAALHADWEKIAPSDVEDLLRGVRELLDAHLS